MTLFILSNLLGQIHAQGEASYPEEGAGLMLGTQHGADKRITSLLLLDNSREQAARHNRYLLTPQDFLRGELEAARLGLDVLGVFHSHPDHPNRPSTFDRDWALPVLSYIITSVHFGKAVESRSWLLSEDRQSFIEEPIEIVLETVL
jgi:proteasome lid subunit RPN8/RPN11